MMEQNRCRSSIEPDYCTTAISSRWERTCCEIDERNGEGKGVCCVQHFFYAFLRRLITTSKKIKRSRFTLFYVIFSKTAAPNWTPWKDNLAQGRTIEELKRWCVTVDCTFGRGNPRFIREHKQHLSHSNQLSLSAVSASPFRNRPHMAVASTKNETYRLNPRKRTQPNRCQQLQQLHINISINI